jgi:MFS family permease
MVYFRGRAIKRRHIVAFALLFNTFSWYFLGRTMVNQLSDPFSSSNFEYAILNVAYPASIIASGIIGAVILTKVNKARLFWAWILLGVFTAISFLIPVNSSAFAAVLTSLLGISVGLGTPACLSYFKESVAIENRGKIAGAIMFATLFGSTTIFLGASAFDFSSSPVFFALWRAWGLIFLFFAPKKDLQLEIVTRNSVSFASILRSRAFLLYFAAWLMFTLVEGFEMVVLDFAQGYELLIRIEPISAAFATLLAGVLSDWIGRKRVLISGFVSLGIAYATIGLLPHIWISWLLFFVIEGIALGSLWVLFMLVLWGDLSPNGSGKFYAIGETPFFVTEMLYLFLTPYLVLIEATSAFSLAAFFLFLAVVPLLYAPETLPERKIRERELKIYIDRAKKVKQKYV